MKQKAKVYNLFNADDRETLSRQLEEQRQRVDRQIEQTSQDIELVSDVDKALAEIQPLLARLHELALAATEKSADREALSEEFAATKARVDAIIDDNALRRSPEQLTRLRELLSEMNIHW